MKTTLLKKLLMFVAFFATITMSAQLGPTYYDFDDNAQGWVKGYGAGVVDWHDGASVLISDGALTLDRTDGTTTATNNNANIRRGQGGVDTFIVFDADVYNFIKVRVFNQTEAVKIEVKGLIRAAGATGVGVDIDPAIIANNVLIAKELGGFQTVYLDVSTLVGEVTRLDLLFRANSALTDPAGAKLYFDEIEFLTEIPPATYSEFIKNPSFDDAGNVYTFKGDLKLLGRELTYDFAKDGSLSYKSTFTKDQDAQFWYFNNYNRDYAAGSITDSKQAKVTMWVRSARTSPIEIAVRLKTTNATGGNTKVANGWPTAFVSTSGTANTWEELTFTIPLTQDHTDPATEVRNIEMWFGYNYDVDNTAMNGVAGEVFYFDQMTAVIEDVSTAGVEDYQQLEGVNIYPNPASDVLTIACPEGSKVGVYSLLGVEVKSIEKASGNFNMEVSGLATGLYIVKVESEGKFYSKKIQIK